MKKALDRMIVVGVLLASILWYFVFMSDLFVSFWYRVTLASIILAIYAWLADRFEKIESLNLVELLIGIASGVSLYLLFYMGFKVFNKFVATGASNVYLFRLELPLIIPAGLLLITSFCEEYFWRRYTQKKMVQIYGSKGIIFTSILYAAIHISTKNNPLIFAAIIAGMFWGILYQYTNSFWIIVFSHITWTELIFVLLPLSQ